MIGVSLGQWCARFGLFHTKSFSKNFVKESNDYDCLLIVSLHSNIVYLIDKPFVILLSLLLHLLCPGCDVVVSWL